MSDMTRQTDERPYGQTKRKQKAKRQSNKEALKQTNEETNRCMKNK